MVPGPTGTLVNVFSDDEIGSAASNELVRHLRHTVLPAVLPAGSYVVGGGPAVFYDFQQALYGDFWWIALIVIVATMAVLFRAFRSVLLPVKAVLMNALSVAGAYGLMVAVFEHGVGADLVGFHRTEQIAVWIPLFLFAFLFGLSMDYEVFLLSRMREEYDAVPDNARAVAAGLAKTGKLITSAALIMVIAFCGLAASRFIEMQQFGFGLAAAILLDATIIRAFIVPSLMMLMGRWNWWLPEVLRPLAGRGPARTLGGRLVRAAGSGRILRLVLGLRRADLDDHVFGRVVRRELVLADHLAVALDRAVDGDGEAAEPPPERTSSPGATVGSLILRTPGDVKFDFGLVFCVTVMPSRVPYSCTDIVVLVYDVLIRIACLSVFTNRNSGPPHDTVASMPSG